MLNAADTDDTYNDNSCVLNTWIPQYSIGCNVGLPRHVPDFVIIHKRSQLNRRGFGMFSSA